MESMVEKVQAAAKLLKAVYRMLFPTEPTNSKPRRRTTPYYNADVAFMTCVIKVNPKESGWQKGVLTLLKNCKGLRFKMSKDGVVEVSGIGDPNKVLEKLGKSKKVEIQWYQFGQCSDNLFMREHDTKKDKEATSSYNRQCTGYEPHYPPNYHREIGYGSHYATVQNGYEYQYPFRQVGYGYWQHPHDGYDPLQVNGHGHGYFTF